MKIAICDDRPNDRAQIQRLCSKFFNDYCIDGVIKVFDSGETLLGTGCDDYDIVLLDVRMPGKNGIQIGQEIRKSNSNIEIVFISSYADYALYGYDVQAYHYLLKNQLEQSFNTCMNGVVKKIRSQKNCRYFKFVKCEMTVYFDDIIYISSRGRRAVFHLLGYESLQEEKRPYLNRKLNDLETDLDDEHFIRISQSYLVNSKHIQLLHNYQAHLKTGELLPISRSSVPSGNQREFTQIARMRYNPHKKQWRNKQCRDTR